MAKKNTNGVAIAVIILGVTTLGALGYYVAQPNANKVPKDELRTTSQHEPPKIEITVPPEKQDSEVTVLTPTFDADGLRFSKQTAEVPHGEDPYVFAVNKYLEQIPAVPKEARLLSCEVDQGVATANFNSTLMAGYGTEDEQMVVNGILATFGTFKEIKSVRILLEGENVETLGNIEIKNPQPVIRP